MFIQEILPKINDGVYAISLDEYKSIATHWIALHVNGYNVTYFDGFAVEHIPKEIKKFSYKNIKTNIYSIQANDSITCKYFSIVYIDFILSLLDYANFFFLTNMKNKTIK